MDIKELSNKSVEDFYTIIDISKLDKYIKFNKIIYKISWCII